MLDLELRQRGDLRAISPLLAGGVERRQADFDHMWIGCLKYGYLLASACCLDEVMHHAGL